MGYGFCFECTHSSGCHERFATIEEFQQHWKEKHQTVCVEEIRTE